jgi:hypothetical protein
MFDHQPNPPSDPRNQEISPQVGEGLRDEGWDGAGSWVQHAGMA